MFLKCGVGLVYALVLICVMSSWTGHKVCASAFSMPTCRVIAEIVEIGVEERVLNTGNTYLHNYVLLKIISIESDGFALVEVGKIYRVNDNYPGTFLTGDRISAGVGLGSSMGPSGAVSFLQWSQLTYENGEKIISATGRSVINSFTGDVEPTILEKDAPVQEHGHVE